VISHDQARALMRAHFSLDIEPAQERQLRLHLADCADCSTLYGRHLVVASLDPRAGSAERRLAVGLGLRQRRRLVARPLQLGFGVAAMAALVLLLVRGAEPDEFAARGGAAGSGMAEMFVYRVVPGQPSQAASGSIRASDPLAFAYVNAAGFSRLMVFGEDEHGHVYWYHPAWSDPAQNPRAIAIQAGPELRELPDSVAHPIDGKMLTIRALFSHTELSVRDVERMLTEQRAPAPGGDARPLAERVGRAREVELKLAVE
jgi:hypothetical protein